MRHATLQDLGEMLKNQHARKIDVVAPSFSIVANDGDLVIADAEPQITDYGVTNTDGRYTPTAVALEGVADKLSIPITYVRKMHADRPDLFDANVNGWLHGNGSNAPDQRSFLVRCFRGDDDNEGIARAFLSDRYRMIDNIDVLMASLDGITDAGVHVSVEGCDLSDRRMYLRVVAPEVTARAEELLRGYRNPFGDEFDRWREMADREGLGYGREEPIVFAGLVITNSEVGNGARTITPRVVVRVCKNGLTIKRDMMREVHLGGKLESGTVDWSADTQQKSVELVRAQTRDAVNTFLSPAYLARAVGDLTEKAAERVSPKQVARVVQPLKFSATEIDGIIERFALGGQMTLGGVAQAISAHAQMLDDSDTAATMEEQAASLLV